MPIRPSHAVARPLAAITLATVSLAAAIAVGSIFLSTARDALAALAAPGPASPADGILVAVALVGVALSLWVGLGMALSALSTLPGALGRASTRLADRIAPAVVRKVIAFVLGTALTAALVPGTAIAGSAHPTPRQAVVTSAQYAVGVLTNVAGTTHASEHGDEDAAPGPSWAPDRRALPANSAGGTGGPGGPGGAGSAGGPQEIVVHRGDNLWSIAARHLGPTATTTEISAEWHRWFAANRQVIGDDANLITPGQVLRPPVPVRSTS